jgi:hypothetical protein
MLLHVVPLTCFIARILRGPWDVIAEFGGERLKTGPLLSIPNALCHAQSVFGQHCRNLMANMAAEQVWLLPGPTPLQWKLFAASCAEMPLNRFTTLCRKDAQAVITSAFRSKWGVATIRYKMGHLVLWAVRRTRVSAPAAESTTKIKRYRNE